MGDVKYWATAAIQYFSKQPPQLRVCRATAPVRTTMYKSTQKRFVVTALIVAFCIVTYFVVTMYRCRPQPFDSMTWKAGDWYARYRMTRHPGFQSILYERTIGDINDLLGNGAGFESGNDDLWSYGMHIGVPWRVASLIVHFENGKVAYWEVVEQE